MDLHEYLEKYKTLTLDIMKEVQKSGEVDFLIEERENIINLINSGDFDKEEIKFIGGSLNLLELEEELQIICKKEKVKVRNQIEQVKAAKTINNNYNNIENRARVFNKSV